MLRTAFVIGLAALPFLVAAAAPAAPVPCPNEIQHEPLVLYDVNGSTLGGPIDISLTVYNDGQARLSSIGQFGNPSKSQLAFPGPAAATQLLLDLSALGAGTLCDKLFFVSDVPTTTLTVFRNATTARNHTFSWLVGVDAYGQIDQRIQTFIQTYFPSF